MLWTNWAIFEYSDRLLGGRIFRVDIATGKILGSIESPGHWIHVTPDRLIFIGSLTGNVLRWYPDQ